jgi:glycosyltransferase involved in cell wall biosynthesis
MPVVVHVSTVHPAFDQRIYHKECASLQAAGFSVHLVVHSDVQGVQPNGVTIHSLGNRKCEGPGLHALARAGAVVRAARLCLGLKAPIYHLHDPELIPLGLMLKRATGGRVIFDAHENYAGFVQQKHYLPLAIRKASGIAMAGLEHLAATRFDAIIVADEGTAELYRAYGATSPCVVRNFPILRLFEMDEGGEVEKEADVVYHGTLPKYHLELALGTASELRRRGRRVRFKIFGDCHVRKWAAEEIATRGLKGLFELGSRVPHEMVGNIVRRAKIGYIPLPNLPKFQQNIPTKLFEFLALGLPVVATDLPPSRGFLGDGGCGVLVPPHDVRAHADAISRLLDDEELRSSMGQEGRRRVCSLWNWEYERERLLSKYRELLR